MLQGLIWFKPGITFETKRLKSNKTYLKSKLAALPPGLAKFRVQLYVGILKGLSDLYYQATAKVMPS